MKGMTIFPLKQDDGDVRRYANRRSSATDKEPFDYNLYVSQLLGRKSEIDAHAVGAAAEVIHHIVKSFSYFKSRNGTQWNLDSIPTDEWNERIQDAINGGVGSIPSSEYNKFIGSLDNYQNHGLDPKLLQKLKQEFLKSFIKNLRSYMK